MHGVRAECVRGRGSLASLGGLIAVRSRLMTGRNGDDGKV